MRHPRTGKGLRAFEDPWTWDVDLGWLFFDGWPLGVTESVLWGLWVLGLVYGLAHTVNDVRRGRLCEGVVLLVGCEVWVVCVLASRWF